MNKVMRHFGLPPLGYDLREIYTHADHVLYADIPDMFEMVNLPPNHHFIGPVIWSPKVAPPPWWNRLPADKPIVYVTPGSSGHPHLLNIVLRALADMPVTAIVATTGKPVPPNLPPNIYTADYLPGLEACKRASLVICNGGSPTTHQALSAGKPVLAFPSNLDQFLNMQGICRNGLGEQLRTNTLCKHSFKKFVVSLIQADQHVQSVQAIADKIIVFNGSKVYQSIIRG
jgi:UDP:flavonoid glycosyltransferase YjiC (YdhE family)